MKENLKKKLPKGESEFLKYSGMAVKMFTIIGIFTFAGYTLDKKFPNRYHGFTVALSLIGVFGSIYSVIKDLISGK